jgi:mevalonate kinase
MADFDFSSPEMMTSASAPGKVILFGDHAVVYGRSAVAASVSDLRVQVDVALTGTNDVVIHFVDLLREIDGSALKYSVSVAAMAETLGFLAGLVALVVELEYLIL